MLRPSSMAYLMSTSVRGTSEIEASAPITIGIRWALTWAAKA
jgi:hypothetical protein